MAFDAKRKSTVDRRRALYEEASRVIREEYPRRVSLDAVARRVATSRRQLQRAFAEAGETSFRSYLEKVRMARAAELLADGSSRVSDVAQAVGYRRPAQFTRAFRRHHGVPPSNLRDRDVP